MATETTTDGGDPFLPFACLLGQCLLMLVPLLIWYFVAKWVRNDAQTRGVKDYKLWFWLVFLLNLIPLLIYLLAIRPKGDLAPCPRCGAKKLPGGKCPSCQDFYSVSAENRCIHCGGAVETSTGMCPHCGSPL